VQLVQPRPLDQCRMGVLLPSTRHLHTSSTFRHSRATACSSTRQHQQSQVRHSRGTRCWESSRHCRLLWLRRLPPPLLALLLLLLLLPLVLAPLGTTS
jgi:hypothetical protein